MKLYEMSNFIRKIINIFIIVVVLISSYTYIMPAIEGLYQSVKPEKPPEIPYKLQKINFTIDPGLKYNLVNTKINYLGNPDSQWNNLQTKKLIVYNYNFSTIEDIDYTQKAKQIALGLGYDDSTQRDNAEASNKYAWVKNGLIFEIDKITKRMLQIPQKTNLSEYKQYVSAGNFLSPESPNSYITNFLRTTGRFNSVEIEQLELEPQFLRFENSNLVDSNNIASEISYVKVFRKISDLKVVSKRYEFPQIYFYVSSLRPEIETNFKNYRFIHFKLNKLDYSPSYNNYAFDLTPLPEVVNQLKQGSFIISDVKFSGDSFAAAPSPSTTSISTITFDTYELGYYDNYDETIKNENIQPIYIFKGSVELDSGLKGRITAYLPAIASRFYNQ